MAQSDAAVAVQNGLEQSFLLRAYLDIALTELARQPETGEPLYRFRLKSLQEQHDALHHDIEQLYREMP